MPESLFVISRAFSGILYAGGWSAVHVLAKLGRNGASRPSSSVICRLCAVRPGSGKMRAALSIKWRSCHCCKGRPAPDPTDRLHAEA
ncbi:hypothetical protein E0H38_24215 [Rhizobium leguminosarum bv. viciae]|nr:hypothetical protein E0H38_24215 [Rhizobium leguminosarum bv. viciae]